MFIEVLQRSGSRRKRNADVIRVCRKAVKMVAEAADWLAGLFMYSQSLRLQWTDQNRQAVLVPLKAVRLVRNLSRHCEELRNLQVEDYTHRNRPL
jgi:hypothetical protein